MPVETHTSLRTNHKFTQDPGDTPWPGGIQTVEVVTITYDQDAPTLDYWQVMDATGRPVEKQWVSTVAPAYVQSLIAACLDRP